MNTPNHQTLNLGVIGRNVRWGIGQGLAFAAIASVAVSIYEIPRWAMYGPHVWLVVGVYFAAGLSIGAVVGLLRPLRDVCLERYSSESSPLSRLRLH